MVRREMKKEYVTWLVRDEQLMEEQELELTIRDLTPGREKYTGLNVKAILSSSPDKLPDGDILWIRSGTGVLHPQPWAIKITGDLGEFLSRSPFNYADLLAK